MQHELAVNTRNAYAHCWQRFARWCGEVGRESMPASVETVRLFVAWSIQTHLRIETIKLNLAAIRHRYRVAGLPPPMDQTVRDLVRNAKRKLREKSGAKRALTPEQLREISQELRRDGRVIAARDRALLVLTFALGWRRSEMAALEIADVAFADKGVVVHLGASKTDQEGQGRDVWIPPGKLAVTCPVRALRAWLRVRGDWAGALFCRCPQGTRVERRAIRGNMVCHVLKQALVRIGEDAAPYGGNSLRAGMITAAAEKGAPDQHIMQRTGQRSQRTLQRYVRPVRAFRANPLDGVL